MPASSPCTHAFNIHLLSTKCVLLLTLSTYYKMRPGPYTQAALIQGSDSCIRGKCHIVEGRTQRGVDSRQ